MNRREAQSPDMFDQLIPESLPHSPNLRCEESSMSDYDDDEMSRALDEVEVEEVGEVDELSDDDMRTAYSNWLALERYRELDEQFRSVQKERRELGMQLATSEDDELRRQFLSEFILPDDVASNLDSARAVETIGEVIIIPDDDDQPVPSTPQQIPLRRLTLPALSKRLKADRKLRQKRKKMVLKGVQYLDQVSSPEDSFELDFGENRE